MRIRTIVVLALTVAVASCGSSTADPSDEANPSTTSAVASTNDSGEFRSEFPCEGGAFPDDEEFRHLLCEVQGLMTTVFKVGVDVDPSWAQRQAEATLAYADDREAAEQLLRDLASDMRDAGLG